MTQSLPESADRNLATMWAAIGRLTGDSGRVGDVHLYTTGLPVAFFNGAVVTGTSDDPRAMMADIIGFMKGRQVPWLLWARPGVDDDLLEAGRAAGLKDRTGPPAMGLSSIPGRPPAIPAELSIEVVTDAGGLDAHRDLMSRAFELPEDIVRRLVPDRLLADKDFTFLLGRVKAEPVSTSLLWMSGDTAGIYSVATPVEHQRRGYGAALTWSAVSEGARQGADHSILQASEAGRPVYERMGFSHLGTYVHLLGAPA